MQYFIGVTVLAMVPELPEIVNGIQFALQNNISLRYSPLCFKSRTPSTSKHTKRAFGKRVCLVYTLCVHSLEVGSCIAVQVCMIQIPLLILFNAFYVSEVPGCL